MRHETCSYVSGQQRDTSEDPTMRPTRQQIERLVMQMQSAFFDDAALSLTLSAARRRFSIDAFVGAGVLNALVDARVLTHREGVYRRYLPRPAVQPAA
jgi:hypothetical protein